MIGLSKFKHHVVRCIDHVVNGAHTQGAEAIGDPARRRFDLDAVDNSNVEKATEIGVDDVH